jgi:acyl-CoA:acyl-CoA alkyltransferase
MYTVGHSRLISTGLYLPEQRITSRELMDSFDSKGRFDINYDWLERTTGIKERRMAPPDMKPSDMAVAAAKQAMDKARVTPGDIDAIIYAGMVRDHIEPATAHIVQHKLKAVRALAFDVSNACLGFMSAIHLMDSLVATGQARRGLVVTGELGYRYARKACEILLKSEDRGLFTDLVVGMTLGDAGAAMIVGPKLSPESGFMGFLMESHGEYHELCVCGQNGEDGPLTTKITEIVQHTAKYIRPMYDELMGKLKWQSTDLNRYIPHQVGMRTTKRHAEGLQLQSEIVPITVDYLGNIISATIPVNLALLEEKKMLRSGEKIYLAGSGSGICLSQAGLIWDAA